MKTFQSLIAIGILAFGLYPFPTQAGPPISRTFFAQNAWMPATVGDKEPPPGGDLETLLPVEVKQSGVQLMRYGGKTVDNHYCVVDPCDSLGEYLSLVDIMIDNK